jgi:hypothetical protein
MTAAQPKPIFPLDRDYIRCALADYNAAHQTALRFEQLDITALIEVVNRAKQLKGARRQWRSQKKNQAEGAA